MSENDAKRFIKNNTALESECVDCGMNIRNGARSHLNNDMCWECDQNMYVGQDSIEAIARSQR
jgi:hypothetical protein